MLVTVLESPPATPETPPDYDEDDDRVHSIFFWMALFAAILGIGGLVLSRAWSTYAPRYVHLIAFDQTADLRGSVTYHVDTKTLVPLSSPSSVDAQDVQHTYSLGQPDSRNTLFDRTDSLRVGSSAQAGWVLQYLVDAADLHNVSGATAWAFTGGNQVDRSPTYTINFPFGMGGGPFQYWSDETGRPVLLHQVGAPLTTDGLTLVRLTGQIDQGAVDPRYVSLAGYAGIPSQMTMRQLSAVTGFDFVAYLPVLGRHLTADEGTAVDTPIPLDYTMSGGLTLLVEPQAGTIVAVEQVDRSFSATVDRGGLAVPRRVLEAHRDVPGDTAALAAVDRLMAATPTPVYDLHLAQTAASVKALSDYAADQRDWVDRIRNGIPRMLLIAGIVLLAVAVLSGLVAWRRRDEFTMVPGAEET